MISQPRNYIIVNPADVTPEVEAMLVCQTPLPNGQVMLKVKRALVQYTEEQVGPSTLLHRELPAVIKAIAIGPAMCSEVAGLKLEAERLAEKPIEEIQIEADKEAIDISATITASASMKSLDLKEIIDGKEVPVVDESQRDATLAILTSKYTTKYNGYDSLQYLIKDDIDSWAAARQIDTLDAKDEAEALQIIDKVLGIVA